MEFIGAQPTVDLTYSDVFLVPRHSTVGSRLQVDLAPHDGTPATLPLVAANMNSVTGPRLAAVLARRGGLGVLPQDMSLPALEESIRRVKAQHVALDTPILVSQSATASEALRQIPIADGHGVVVVDDDMQDGSSRGSVPAGAVRGALAARRLVQVPPDARLGDLIQGPAPTVDLAELGTGRRAFETVDAVLASAAEGAETAPETVCIIDDGVLAGALTRRSALRGSIYRPAVDSSGRLAVAVAVGINGDVAEKARRLVASGADVLVVDTAHGHQDGMLAALRTVAGLGLDVPIVAGNVVTADGVRDLVAAGASILKVGVGPGAMCTTRMMTAVGRPQFSAALETVGAAREFGAYVWADGGVRYPRDVALALAAGSSSVMIGSWFAGTAESPGELRADASGQQYKESWGMASTKAVQARFSGLDAYERARKELFAEGISSSKIYIDPLRPGVEDLLDMITSGVRSSFTYTGAETLADFHVRAHVGLQSAAGYEEGKALPVSW